MQKTEAKEEAKTKLTGLENEIEQLREQTIKSSVQIQKIKEQKTKNAQAYAKNLQKVKKQKDEIAEEKNTKITIELRNLRKEKADLKKKASEFTKNIKQLEKEKMKQLEQLNQRTMEFEDQLTQKHNLFDAKIKENNEIFENKIQILINEKKELKEALEQQIDQKNIKHEKTLQKKILQQEEELKQYEENLT